MLKWGKSNQALQAWQSYSSKDIQWLVMSIDKGSHQLKKFCDKIQNITILLKILFIFPVTYADVRFYKYTVEQRAKKFITYNFQCSVLILGISCIVK